MNFLRENKNLIGMAAIALAFSSTSSPQSGGPLYFNVEPPIKPLTRKDLSIKQCKDGRAIVDPNDGTQVYFFTPIGEGKLETKVLEHCAFFATKSPAKYTTTQSVAFDEVPQGTDPDKIEYSPQINYTHGIALPINVKDRYPDKEMTVYCNYHNYVVVQWI